MAACKVSERVWFFARSSGAATGWLGASLSYLTSTKPQTRPQSQRRAGRFVEPVQCVTLELRSPRLFHLVPGGIRVIDGHRFCKLCRVGTKILFVNRSRRVDYECHRS